MSHIFCILIAVIISTVINYITVIAIAKRIIDFAADGDSRTMEFCYVSTLKILKKMGCEVNEDDIRE